MTTRTTGYQSDDEYTSRKYKQYSREDFKEIYCINQKAIEGLEKSRSTGFLFLGCLSAYQENSPCRRRHHTSTPHSQLPSTESSSNIFTSCYSTDRATRATASEEDLSLRPRYVYYYHEPVYSQTSGGSSQSCVVRGDRPRSAIEIGGVSRESLYNEARKWVWSGELDRYVETSSFQSTLFPVKKTPASRFPSAPLQAQISKHVSFYSPDYFTRSATSNSFDEHKIRRARFEMMNGGVSQERLIDGRCKTPDPTSSLIGSRTSLSLVVKSQATQTENFIASRAGGPSEYLSLSPRVAQRSRMVSQPTQTNGIVPLPLIAPSAPQIQAKTCSPMDPPLSPTSQTEEEFHENFFPLFSPPLTTSISSKSPQTIVSRSPSNKSHSPNEETSSEGSYSLDKFKLNNIIPPFCEQVEMETMVLQPPEGFGDENNHEVYKKKKKKSIRAKSEERYGYKTDASTQSSVSLHASLHDLCSGGEDDDCGIYLEAYSNGVWVYISAEEEVNCWNRHGNNLTNPP